MSNTVVEMHNHPTIRRNKVKYLIAGESLLRKQVNTERRKKGRADNPANGYLYRKVAVKMGSG